MKKSMKKIVLLIMVISVLFTCFMITASAATGTGNYNNYYTFTYNTTGYVATLTKNTNLSQTWKLPNLVTCKVNNKYTDFTVTALSSSFFLNSSNAKYVTYLRLPNTLVNIQNGLFQGNYFSYLKTIEIYGADTTCNDVFMDCNNLTEFIVNENNATLKTVDGVLYNDGGLKLQKFPAAKALDGTTVYEIPDGTASIGGFAFYKAKNVTDVKVPASVTAVGKGAFCGDNIKGVHFEDGSTYDFSTYTCYCSNYGFSSTCAEKFCMEDVEKLAPTCSAPGHTAGIRCDITGEWFSGEEIPTTDHSFTVFKEVKPATCTEDGARIYECAYKCGETDEKTIPNSVLGHKGGKATCVAAAVCETCYVSYGEIDTDAHSFSKYSYNNDATCTKDGTETALCDNGCGETETVKAENTAKGHSFALYVKSEEASCGKNAKETAVCENGCDLTDTREIAGTALSHTAGTPVISNKVAPTCDKAGSYRETVKCQKCAAVLTSETKSVPALGHADANGDYICDNGGEKLRSPQDDCTHMCHKTGFMGFIWKIVRFFQKLFKMNPLCECGAAHY